MSGNAARCPSRGYSAVPRFRLSGYRPCGVPQFPLGQFGFLAFAAVDARLGGRLGDGHRGVLEAGRSISGAIGESVLKEFLVVAILELVQARVRAAGLLAVQRRLS